MMRIIALLVVIAAVGATKILQEDHSTHFDWRAIMDAVNVEGSTWTASVPARFENATHASAKRMLGTILPHEEGYMGPEVMRTTFRDNIIPLNFDVREAWPECKEITGHVRDQSSCGSCWAFGSTEAFNDRYCIKTGDASTLFSPEDTVACCTGMTCSMSMGCNGGQPAGAWNWFVKEGVVSGGDYDQLNTGNSCSPYSLENCAHHVEPSPWWPMNRCDDLPDFPTPKCPKQCENGYPVEFAKDKHFASSSYGIKGIENMQQELMEKGTLSVTMTVYEDFEAYTSGVYQHKTGKSLGGHAIKMIGWGVDEATGTPYWTCTNSWNPTWGEKGNFRILRGSNECGIESGVVAGDA